MRPERSFVLYEHPRFHAAFPSLAPLRDGGVLLAFRRARDPRWLLGEAAARRASGWASHYDPRSHVCLLRLDGGLRADTEVDVLPFDPECADQDASLLTLADGRVALGSFSYYPFPSASAGFVLPEGADGLSGVEATSPLQLTSFVLMGSFVCTSDDGGRTFGPRVRLPPLARGGAQSLSGAMRGAMVEHEGAILAATYVDPAAFAGAGVTAVASSPHAPSAVAVHASLDGGRSFAHRHLVSDPTGRIGLHEPSLVRTAAGDVVLLCRTSHAGDRLVTARSHDGGHSFEPLTTHAVVGHPFAACPLPDGRILLTYGYRHAPYGIRARIVDPDLRHIDDADELVLRDDGLGVDLGYPWPVTLADGRVLVAYYMTTTEGARRLEATILTT
jgi:hypothetical protein